MLFTIVHDGGSGFDFVREMKENGHQFDIVFMAVDKTCAIAVIIENYDDALLRLLIKPIEVEKLRQALHRAIDGSVPKRLIFKTARGVIATPMNELLYIESYDHTIFIHKSDGTTATIIATLTQLENDLPPMQFCRPHKSFLVNMAQISEIVRYEITLRSGIKIPIGKGRYTDMGISFAQYAQQKNRKFFER